MTRGCSWVRVAHRQATIVTTISLLALPRCAGMDADDDDGGEAALGPGYQGAAAAGQAVPGAPGAAAPQGSEVFSSANAPTGSGGATSGTGGGLATVIDGAVVPAPPPAPPEEELESSFRVPVATGRFLWSANPDSGYVAVLDARSDTLEVHVHEAGHAPTYLAAVSDPEDDSVNQAIVLNVRSHDATLLAVKGSGELESSETFPTHQGANALAISASGN